MATTEQRDEERIEKTLRFNKELYANYYSKPGLMLQYDMIYRAGRIPHLLADNGVDLNAPGFRVCDYGFGAGHLMLALAEADEVYGVEFAPSAIERANAQKPADHPSWNMVQWDDPTDVPLDDDFFDLFCSSHVLEHLDNDDKVLDEWIRMVKPGGYLLTLLPANEQLFEGSKHLRLYDRDEFAARLEAKGLEKVVIDEHQRFDRPFKHHKVILFQRRGFVRKMLFDIPKTLSFLPASMMNWKLLAGLDGVLEKVGAPSTSIAYLYRKPLA